VGVLAGRRPFTERRLRHGVHRKARARAGCDHGGSAPEFARRKPRRRDRDDRRGQLPNPGAVGPVARPVSDPQDRADAPGKFGRARRPGRGYRATAPAAAPPRAGRDRLGLSGLLRQRAQQHDRSRQLGTSVTRAGWAPSRRRNRGCRPEGAGASCGRADDVRRSGDRRAGRSADIPPGHPRSLCRGRGRPAGPDRDDAPARWSRASAATYRPRLAHGRRPLRGGPAPGLGGERGALMEFLSPAWLLLLIPVGLAVVGYFILQLRRKKYVARFSNVSLLASVAPKRPGWRRHLTFALLIAGLAVLAFGAAQPTAAVHVPRDRATVMMAIDVSESMRADDVLPTRLQAAQQAAKQFADLLPPRINLGLVKFSGTASVLVPPTIDRDSVKVAIDGLELDRATAIGEAVFSCLDAIKTFSKSTTSSGDQPPPARIVLMSDGTSNTGRAPEAAAAAAADAKVPVSTIAFGTDNGTVDIEGERIPVPADKSTLKAIAQTTGGTFHTAASAAELQTVYKDIGTQIGYSTEHRDISWRFLLIGMLLTLSAAGTSLLWAGRLL